MIKPRIIVFGSEGMLGAYVTKYFQINGYTVMDLNRTEFDVGYDGEERLDELFSSWQEHKTVIINCLGLIPHRNPDRKALIEVNTIFPHTLARCAKYFGMRLIHITTDCVFSGIRHPGKYMENDIHDALDLYGRTKSLGEPIDDALVIRTSIIGEERKNKLSLLEWVKSAKGQTIKGYSSHYWNGVTCLQLAKLLEWVTQEPYRTGVYHYFTPNEVVSKYDLVCMINKVYDLGVTVQKSFPMYMTDVKYMTLGTNNKIWPLLVPPTLEQQLIEQKEFNIFDYTPRHP